MFEYYLVFTCYTLFNALIFSTEAAKRIAVSDFNDPMFRQELKSERGGIT
jgi:hypothetical protein